MRILTSRIIATVDGTDLSYVEISGSKDETKPTKGIADGSIFLESDTGMVSFFSEANSDWVDQFSFQS